MKILLSWLNEYGDFGDPTDADAVRRVADALTSLGLEVDSDRRGRRHRRRCGHARGFSASRAHPDAAKVQRV